MRQPGSRLGPYEIVTLLGSGGMGEVYRATDPRLGRDVAVKVLSGATRADADQLARFEEEARAAAALHHPSLVAVLDVGSQDGTPYVVFELLEGDTLRARLGRGPLPAGKAIEYAVQLCEGLAAVHEKGIVHRDLKPENVFLTRDGHAKILDFGVAKLVRSPLEGDAATRHETARGQLVGTLAYMSPEQARGEAIDSRTDLFALGAMLHEMLAGVPAFQRPSAAETLTAILNADPAPIPPQPGGITPALLSVLRRCLEKEPHERFQSARDLGFALAALRSSLPASQTAHASLFGGARRSWLLLLATGALIVAIGSWMYTTTARRDERSDALSAVPFTSFPGQEVAPAFSPDGNQIAFAWSPEGLLDRFDLYVKVLGRETPLRLTTQPADFIAAAWSPDGRDIAFARMSARAGGLFLISSLGGPERKLSDAQFDYFLETIISWSPDGKMLAFYDKGPSGAFGISYVDVATLEKTWRGTPSPDCSLAWAPAFSPDGTSLAVACMITYGVNDVFIWPDGGTARRIERIQGDFTGLAWAPDGQSLIVAADGALARVAVSGGESRTLLAARDAVMPAVAPKARRLAYTTQTLYNVNVWQVPLAGTAQAAGAPTKFLSSSRATERPAFSPDGRLAFESNRTGSTEVWVSDADGSNARPVTDFRGPWTGSPAWSPDGNLIALDSRTEGHSALYVVKPDGGPARRVPIAIEDSAEPEWSADGQWLFFTGAAHGNTQVYKVRREGGTPAALTTGGGNHPRVWRADPSRVYYSHDGQVCTVSAGGGDERCPPQFPRLSRELGDSWLLTDGGFYFIETSAPGPALKFFDFKTAQTRHVADLTGRPNPFAANAALSPDGKRLLYAQLDAIASDIMLVEHLR